MSKSIALRAVFLVAAFVATGCTGSSPRLLPGRVMAAVFQYQLDTQVTPGTRTAFLSSIDPPLHRPVSQAVRALVRPGKVRLLPSETREMPDASLTVETMAERIYPDSYVVLGLVGSEGYRYRFDLQDGVWRMFWVIPVEVDTDCYGNYWVIRETGEKQQ